MQIERVQREEARRLEKEMKRKAEQERAQQQLQQIANTLKEMANANADFAARREAILKVRLTRGICSDFH